MARGRFVNRPYGNCCALASRDVEDLAWHIAGLSSPPSDIKGIKTYLPKCFKSFCAFSLCEDQNYHKQNQNKRTETRERQITDCIIRIIHSHINRDGKGQ